jgi:Tir chaperone protein (CesT) family
MTSGLLHRVLGEFCREAGVAAADAASIVDTGRLVVRDVDITVSEGRPGDPGGFFVQADFGPVPEHDALLALRRLLEINLHLAGADGPAFGIDARTGRVAMVARLAPSAFDMPTLAITLEQIAVFAAQWRETHFIEAGESAAAASAVPAAAPSATTASDAALRVGTARSVQ